MCKKGRKKNDVMSNIVYIRKAYICLYVYILITNEKYIKIYELEPINFDLKSRLEKLAILEAYKNFLNILILIFKF